jgi:hypothetical protein
MKKKIAYDVRTGTPEGIPLDFIKIVIEFPDRIYGTWWLEEEGSCGEPKGWYIWVESIQLLGVSLDRPDTKVVWNVNGEFEERLDSLAKRLLGKRVPQTRRRLRFEAKS